MADELLKVQLKNNCENKEKEIKDLSEKLEESERKLAEGKFKDNLILSKDSHIEDLKTRIAELQNTDNVFKQIVGLVNQEIVQLKSFIKEELKASQIEQVNKNSQTYEESSIEVKSMKETLNSCQLNLNKTQNVVSDYKDQLESKNNNIDENTDLISKLKEELKESQLKLNEYQVDLKNQKEIIEHKEEEILNLNGQIKKNEVKAISCIDYGDSNSVNNIVIPNFKPFPALCDSVIAGLGWTVIQQRLNGGEDFYRNWETYRNGFGEFTGDFFLGLENIYRLTSDRRHELYIHMKEFSGKTFYARYDNFRIAGEADKYRLLSLGLFTGTADKDRMRVSENQMFSTFDSDNDLNGYTQCAVLHNAGWWYGPHPCSDGYVIH